jgi:hypothetical protein
MRFFRPGLSLGALLVSVCTAVFRPVLAADSDESDYKVPELTKKDFDEFIGKHQLTFVF